MKRNKLTIIILIIMTLLLSINIISCKANVSTIEESEEKEEELSDK